MIANHRIQIVLILFIGIITRFLCSLQSPNYDYYSWEIVADLFLKGKLIYSNTPRYNYGPVWFHILGFFRNLDIDFRFSIILFLSFVDLSIFFILYRLRGIKEATIFFLCPITIIITGYHHQFEDLAILPILIGIFYMVLKYDHKVSFSDAKWEDVIILSTLIGFSLAIKHIFILFPLWLFFQTNDFLKRIFILLIPILVFGSAFLFYWNEGRSGIISNVFLYSSYNNFPIYQVFYYDLFFELHKWKRSLMKYLFLSIVVMMGFILRKRNLMDTFLLYCACFVCFSSAIANQYLVIPVLFLAFNFYSSAWAYFIIGGVVLVFLDKDGMHFLSEIYPYSNFSGKNWYKLMAFFLLLNIISALNNKDLLLDFLKSAYQNLSKLVREMRDEILLFIFLKK